jgi:hypothetical protein
VPEHRVTETATVDVAWLREGVATPLFIFEVETRASGGATNNASKVYGQDNQRLVKPLFFFHVFMARSEGSERITTLDRLFGTRTIASIGSEWIRRRFSSKTFSPGTGASTERLILLLSSMPSPMMVSPPSISITCS